MYSKQELLKGLTTVRIGRKMFVFEEIDSTNACAKALAEIEIEDGTIVIADHQSAGRGRHGRTWISDPGKNLLFSIVVKPRIGQDRLALLSFYAAVGVARGIEAMLQCRIEVKWPNDVLINKRKCCGILLENSLSADKLHYAIIGIGINVNQQKFGKDIIDRATSLRNEMGKPIDRKELFHYILQSLDSLYVQVQKGKFDVVLKEWLSRFSMIGKKISLLHHEETIKGTIQAVNHDGSIVLKTAKGLQSFYAGDVTLRIEEKK